MIDKLQKLPGVRQGRLLIGGALLLSTLICLIGAAYLFSPCQYFTLKPAQVPRAQAGMFNVAVVLSSNPEDSSWSKTHAQAAIDLAGLPGVFVQLIEPVPEFCPSEQIFTRLAERGYQLVVGAAFGYMDAMQAAATRFPETTYINVLGMKQNDANFDNLNGAMEEMMYLAGMLSGARAQQDGSPRLGYIATFTTPEQFRWANAAARGMRLTCPTCAMYVSWLNSWNDPQREKELARDLFARNARVVISASESGHATLEAAAEKTAWAVVSGSAEVCSTAECLAAPYWNWGPVYRIIANEVRNRTYQPRSVYFHTDSGGLGLYGLMSSDAPTPGMQDLPAEVMTQIRLVLFQMLSGDQNVQLSIFKGPISDNRGREKVPAGEILERKEIDQFPPGDPNNKCRYCMCWWVEGIDAELPEICTNPN